MNVRLLPNYTDEIKQRLADFLTSCFQHPQLESELIFPLSGYPLWSDGELLTITHGGWGQRGSEIAIGQRPVGALRTEYFSLVDRFSVLSSFVPLVRDLIDPAEVSTAIARILLGEYTELRGNLIQSTHIATKLAISPSGSQIAAFYSGVDGQEDGFYSPLGELLSPQEDWTIIEI